MIGTGRSVGETDALEAQALTGSGEMEHGLKKCLDRERLRNFTGGKKVRDRDSST